MDVNSKANESSITDTNNKVIFWGHQSVGDNLIEGLVRISDEKLKITHIDDGSLGNGIIHKAIGQNGNPSEKILDFKHTLINWEIDESPDVIMMKFCYLDIYSETDIYEVFEGYKEMVDQVSSKFPNAKFVHITVPLTRKDSLIKTLIKRILGRNTYGNKDNILREQYNDLLRNEYHDNLFDLALYESTDIDGKRTSYRYKGETVFSLNRKFASDNGHLNEIGQDVISEKLLNLIASL